ncbi:152R [Invertebrate iridescent virus Kaz2018]|uniref:152R n=2 Tax=Iridovirus TaxID=10487 RepID=Q91FZ9_IIV6|nr:152R [Invertebrate iridescent virus 6]AAK82033.1 152R [Invertebrate iridescent virus 6]QMS79499.1 hypothetical protein IIV6-T1_154 [Invertebrate iridescent virus 6]QNH08562.1 152R [Invertebrate iridescent virus Kaz2018]
MGISFCPPICGNSPFFITFSKLNSVSKILLKIRLAVLVDIEKEVSFLDRI